MTQKKSAAPKEKAAAKAGKTSAKSTPVKAKAKAEAAPPAAAPEPAPEQAQAAKPKMPPTHPGKPEQPIWARFNHGHSQKMSKGRNFRHQGR